MKIESVLKIISTQYSFLIKRMHRQEQINQPLMDFTYD